MADFNGNHTPAFGHLKVMQFKQDSIDEGNRTVYGYASTPARDRDQERILPKAFTRSLPTYMTNPVMYWNHQWWTVPIANAVATEVREDGLFTGVRFGSTDLAEEVWTAVAKDQTVRSMSVGFNGWYSPEYGYWDKEADEWVWTDLDLLEISVVGIPSNAEATFQLSKQLGLSLPAWWAKGVSLFGDLPLAPEDTPWDPYMAEKRVRELAGEKIGPEHSRAFLWKETGPGPDPEHRLCIADVIEGELQAVWKGVAAATGFLLGAKGDFGVDLSPADRKGAFDHAMRYYGKAGKKAPEFEGPWPQSFKSVEFFSGELDALEETIAMETSRRLTQGSKSVLSIVQHWAKSNGVPPAAVCDNATRSIVTLASALKAGQVLSGVNRTDIEEAVGLLQGVLDRDSRSSDEKSAPQPTRFDPEMWALLQP